MVPTYLRTSRPTVLRPLQQSSGLVSGVQDLGLGSETWDQGYGIWCLRTVIWVLWFGI